RREGGRDRSGDRGPPARIPGTHYAAALWRAFLRADRRAQEDAARDGQEQTLSSQGRIERKVVGRDDVNACRRPLDPLDAEALAAAAAPVCASDAAEHARQCPACAAMVAEAVAFARALDELAGLPAGGGTETPDLAGGIVRLRPFSRRERRDFSLWRGA